MRGKHESPAGRAWRGGGGGGGFRGRVSSSFSFSFLSLSTFEESSRRAYDGRKDFFFQNIAIINHYYYNSSGSEGVFTSAAFASSVDAEEGPRRERHYLPLAPSSLPPDTPTAARHRSRAAGRTVALLGEYFTCTKEVSIHRARRFRVLQVRQKQTLSQKGIDNN